MAIDFDKRDKLGYTIYSVNKINKYEKRGIVIHGYYRKDFRRT